MKTPKGQLKFSNLTFPQHVISSLVQDAVKEAEESFTFHLIKTWLEEVSS